MVRYLFFSFIIVGLFPLSLTFISGCWIFDFNLRHCLEDQLLTVPQEHTVIDSPLTMHSQGKGRRAHGLRKGREKHVTDIPEAQDLMPAVRVMLAGLMRH
jgi:hypothetical protein